MILTEADIAKYAPLVTLTGDALTGALIYLQALIESDRCAGRSLEMQQYTEKSRVHLKTQTVWLSNSPLVNPPEPIIKVRLAHVQDRFRRVMLAQDWTTLTPEQYQIDRDGQIILRNAMRGWTTSLNSVASSEAEVTYTAGLDFTQDTPEVNRLKAAAGQLLMFVVKSGVFKGISSESYSSEYSVNYIGDLPGFLTIPFWKYRPR